MFVQNLKYQTKKHTQDTSFRLGFNQVSVPTFKYLLIVDYLHINYTYRV